jgi:hypothetical protein
MSHPPCGVRVIEGKHASAVDLRVREKNYDLRLTHNSSGNPATRIFGWIAYPKGFAKKMHWTLAGGSR